MTPTIPDEAVRSAPERIWTCNETKNIWIGERQEDTVEYVRADLAATFLQGVKVKALAWTQKAPPAHDHEPFVYWADGIGGHYRAERDGVLWYAHDAFHWKQFGSQKEAKAAAQADYEARILSAIEPAPSPRAQALEEAAQVADKGNTGWLKKRDVTANKKEARDYETMAIACSHVAAAIRALSSQPVADALPQDVINLVIAAREFWDDYNNFSDESKSLDKALEAFASRVPYENEPDDLPSSPGASE